MREELLHFIWKAQKFSKTDLKTTDGEPIEILSVGFQNTASGPDFFNTRLLIAGQEWAGNLEIHLNSSHWYAHGHEKDHAYDNVILHVVWEDDIAIFRKDGTKIPSLELKSRVSVSLFTFYEQLLKNKRQQFINCELQLSEVPDVVVFAWLERLYVSRLERKATQIQILLKKTKNDWEAVLFLMLMKNFGLNKNGAAFLELASFLDFKMVQKLATKPLQLEALFMGTLHFFQKEASTDAYFQKLDKAFQGLRHKFQLQAYHGEQPQFFGLRPSNFPSIRLSQIASLYEKHPKLFSILMDCKTLKDFYKVLETQASAYWDTHYTFGKVSPKRVKSVSKSFIELLISNTIIPLKFAYNRSVGNSDVEGILALSNTLPPEKNNILEGFNSLGLSSHSALESQGKIELFKNYCEKNKCIQCQIGIHLLGRKGYF